MVLISGAIRAKPHGPLVCSLKLSNFLLIIFILSFASFQMKASPGLRSIHATTTIMNPQARYSKCDCSSDRVLYIESF